jgi:hypothetical protein
MSPRELLPLADSLAIFLVEHRSQIPIRLCFQIFQFPFVFSLVFHQSYDTSFPGQVSPTMLSERQLSRGRNRSDRSDLLEKIGSARCEATGRGSPYRDGSMHQARHPVGLVTSFGVAAQHV